MKRMKVRKKQLLRLISYLVAILISIIWLIPIVSTIFISFKTEKEIMMEGTWTIPKTLHLDTYVNLWLEIKSYFINSLVVTIPAAVLSVFIASLGAYAFARKKFSGNNVIFMFLLGGMLIPAISCVVPVFLLIKKLALYNTYLAQILVHISFSMPFCVFMLRNFFITIPLELDEAARIDGCSELNIILKIIIPLAMPGIVTLMGFQFIWIWNNLIWGLILTTGKSVQPIMVGILRLKGSHSIAWNIQCAGVLISMLPPLFIFLILQKNLFKALAMQSGIKG
jgi:ABC-type glycerol-3-phosphate transport system permease component